jgi:hypothetical protein
MIKVTQLEINYMDNTARVVFENYQEIAPGVSKLQGTYEFVFEDKRYSDIADPKLLQDITAKLAELGIT